MLALRPVLCLASRFGALLALRKVEVEVEVKVEKAEDVEIVDLSGLSRAELVEKVAIPG